MGDCGVVANVLDYSSSSEFKLKSCYYIHFQTNILGKGMNPFIFSSYWLNSTTTFFYKDGFDIK